MVANCSSPKLKTMDSYGARHKVEEAGTSSPEERLNLAIVCTAIVSKAMNGLGTLATIWATVVLLGGFADHIKQKDFWYVTIVAFVESIGYVYTCMLPALLFICFRSAILISYQFHNITILGWQDKLAIDQQHS
jgi:hypothetical protein